MKADKQEYFLSIDNGTQSIRALVFDRDGQLVAKNKVDIVPYTSPHAGWAEQDADYFWSSLCEACQGLWPKLGFPKEEIIAVSVTTQRGTVVAMDKNNRPIGPAISWLDQRRVETKPALGSLESMIMRVIGAKDAVDNFHREAEANWLAQNLPEQWQKVEKYLLLSGYHTYKLTGNYRDSIASQVGYVPFDFRNLEWANDKDWSWRVAPIKRGMLPELRAAGEHLGRISERASNETGIPCGIPLISSGSDKACEVLGSGCLDPSVGSLSYGTTATFNVTTDKYFEAIPFIPAFPGVIPGTYNVEMMVFRGYWMVKWFKQEFGLHEQQEADKQGVSPESLFDDLLRAVPVGSMGLMLQPYWSPLNSTGPEAKGAIIGFGDVHKRAHIYRAMIEGLTYALREGKELIEKRGKRNLTRLKVSGGGSQSDEIMQITADVFGMKVERPHTYETSGLGAAIAAAVGVGSHSSFKAAVEKMTHAGDSFEPNSANHLMYDELYRNVYLKMYGSLQPSYETIRSITGYPS